MSNPDMWDNPWDNQQEPIATQHFYSSEQNDNIPRGQSGRKRDNWRDKDQDRNSREGDNRPTIVKVPNRYVGRIIGRGGSKINDLQFESGARIQVTKEVDGDNTIVKIFGEYDSVRRAKDLINDLTTERASSRQYSPPPKNKRDSDSAPAFTGDWKSLLAESEKLEAEEWAKYPLIQKEFYKEHPTVTAMTTEEVRAFRAKNNNIVVERTFKKEDSKPIPKPVSTFEQAFYMYPEILDEIKKAGFTQPSPIQSQAWPVLLSGEDLIGIAQTGTGKTLAFLLPAFVHIEGQLSKHEERNGPVVLIMAPTRELALQIEKESKKYQYRNITAVCVYGGGNRQGQIKQLSSGVDIVIATPGRLNDLLVSGHLNIKYVTYAVLDEADRMLDMGFEPQIRKVMYAIRPTRQTVMTSATWPLGVRRLAESYMNDPIQVYVGTLDLAAVHTVSQVIEIVKDDEQEKYQRLNDFINRLDPNDKVIVFCGKKARADYLSSELSLNSISVQTMHGDREQADREQALKDIADGTVQILIATDVASRGLDIDDITHVINFDFPRNIEEYVHRVGRTGRAGKCGQSISYFTRQDWAMAKELIKILDEAQQYVPEDLYGMAERYEVWKAKKDADRPMRGGGGCGGGGGRNRFSNSGGSRY